MVDIVLQRHFQFSTLKAINYKVVLRKDVEENPDITLKARADKFNVAPSSICRALKKMNITRKKKQFRYKERAQMLNASSTSTKNRYNNPMEG